MAGKCREYIADLNDFIDGEIGPELCAEIEKHLGQCDNCRLMVDTMRKTVQLCREGKIQPLPPSLNVRLNRLLQANWQKKFGRNA